MMNINGPNTIPQYSWEDYQVGFWGVICWGEVISSGRLAWEFPHGSPKVGGPGMDALGLTGI